LELYRDIDKHIKKKKKNIYLTTKTYIKLYTSRAYILKGKLSSTLAARITLLKHGDNTVNNNDITQKLKRRKKVQKHLARFRITCPNLTVAFCSSQIQEI